MRWFKRNGSPPKATIPPETIEEPPKATTPPLGLRLCADHRQAQNPVDIVFIHGLTGGWEKTWTDKSTSESCFWPKELLPEDLPEARIFTYGYDAKVADFFERVSQSRIGDHAKTLANDLANMRSRTGTLDRPLFFVAHSLGGLVLEDMLSTYSANSNRQKVIESTEGVVFMGTPHCGSRLAEWATMFTAVGRLVNRLNNSIVTVLKPDSEVLARIQDQFHTRLRNQRSSGQHAWRIMCFYEDHDTVGIGAIVPKHSAILPGEDHASIPGDHTGMTKFSSREHIGYQRVSGDLFTWIRELDQRQAQAAQQAHAAPSGQSTEQPQLLLENRRADQPATNYFQGSMSNVGQVFQGTSFHNSQVNW